MNRPIRFMIRPLVFLVVLVILANTSISIGRTQTNLPNDHDFGDAGEWKIYFSGGWDGCFAEQEQSGGTTAILGMLRDQRFTVAFRNSNLGFARKGESYELKLLFNGKSSWDSSMQARHFGGGVFLIGNYAHSRAFRLQFAQSNSLSIRKGERKLATLSLKGTSAALKAIDACLAEMRSTVSIANDMADSGGADRGSLAEASKLNTEATALYEDGNYADAEPLFRQALAIREKELGPEHSDVAASLNVLAILLRDVGDFVTAEPFFRRALKILEKSTSPEPNIVYQSIHDVALANVMHNLAALLSDKGDLDSAEVYFSKALAIRERVLTAEDPDIGSNLNSLAIVKRLKGDQIGAEVLYRRALAINEKALGSEHPLVALSLNNLADILYNTKGDLVQAESLFRRALAIYEKALGSNHPEVARILSNLSSLLRDKGDLTNAESLIRRSLAIREKMLRPEHPFLANSFIGLAVILHQKGDLAGAEQFYRRALEIRETALGREHPDVGQSLNGLASLLTDKGDLAGGLELARKAAIAGHSDRNIYLHALDASKWGNPLILAESFEVIQQTASSSAGSALRSLAVRVTAGSDDLARLIRDEQDLSGELKKLEASIVNEISEEPAKRDKTKESQIRSRTEVVRAEHKRLRIQLNRDFPDFSELSQPQTLNLSDTRDLLGSEEALVIIDVAADWRGKDYVWAVTKESIQWQPLRRLGLDQINVASVIAKLRQGLDLGGLRREPIDPVLANILFDIILGPVEAEIADKKHLIFVLNGAVSSLPPQILVTKPPNGKDFRSVDWLVNDHAITILPTVSSLKLLRTKSASAPARKKLRAYADPIFNADEDGSDARVAGRSLGAFYNGANTDLDALRRGLFRLPATASEVTAVAASLGVPMSEISLRGDATETAVKKAPLDQYGILYFATHGLIAGQVEEYAKSGSEPALALSLPKVATELDDGLLTASEVSQLKLNADWVVLSACNTAAGGKLGADPLSGLARAFFYAGARSLLVSHWVVDDESTSALMSRTFDFAAKHTEERQAEALRQAMLSVMNDPGHPEWADPAYWAPFVLVGEAYASKQVSVPITQLELPKTGPMLVAKPTNRETTIPIGESSNDKKAILTKSANDNIAHSPFWIQIGARSFLAHAKALEDEVRSKYKSIVDSRTFTIQTAEVPGKRNYYRVRLSAESKQDAAEACEKYKRATARQCFVEIQAPSEMNYIRLSPSAVLYDGLARSMERSRQTGNWQNRIAELDSAYVALQEILNRYPKSPEAVRISLGNPDKLALEAERDKTKEQYENLLSDIGVAIEKQVRKCWHIIPGMAGVKSSFSVLANFDENRKLIGMPVVTKSSGSLLADTSGVRAILVCTSDGLNVEGFDHQLWKSVTINFDMTQMFEPEN